MLGCAGSGKTTFGRNLSKRIGARFICLDEIWQPSWTEADVPKFRTLVAEAHAGDRWVSDGNFSRASFDIRLPRANLIVWLERPRLVCAWRAMARTVRSGERHSLKDLPKVLNFIRNFDRVNRPLIERTRGQYGTDVPVVRLRSDHEVKEFLDVRRQV